MTKFSSRPAYLACDKDLRENSRLDNLPNRTNRSPGPIGGNVRLAAIALDVHDGPVRELMGTTIGDTIDIHDDDDGAGDFSDQEERLQHPERDQDALEPDGVGAGFE